MSIQLEMENKSLEHSLKLQFILEIITHLLYRIVRVTVLVHPWFFVENKIMPYHINSTSRLNFINQHSNTAKFPFQNLYGILHLAYLFWQYNWHMQYSCNRYTHFESFKPLTILSTKHLSIQPYPTRQSQDNYLEIISILKEGVKLTQISLW